MGEFWVPIAQNETDGAVVFADLRVMGDNNDNDEYNVGVGYRNMVNATLLGDGIVGGMVWFDRRHTARGSKFNQITAGAEWLGEQYDVRVNAYVPLNDSKNYTQANPNGGAGAGFVGNQILVNTDQTVREEALPGLDLEIGTRLNFLDGVTDATRVYAGGYHFQGNKTDNVTGYRTRISSDVTQDIQLGARFQHDAVRGSQTYLEATVRFPFGNKKSFKEEGLRSRLDESPERDIDIVSNEVVIESGTNAVILNATTGAAQNVVHVDNTAAGGGDGSIERPYNTLAAAQAAATTNDLIYVHRGDGLTTGMSNGITLDDAGQMLIGSGVNLLFDNSRFKTSNGLNLSNGGILVATKTTAPTITNVAGNGVNVTADNVFISGIKVDGASLHGVYVDNADNIIIDTVTANNSASTGIYTLVDGVNLQNISVANSSVDGAVNAINTEVVNSGSVENIYYKNNITNNATANGQFISANSGSRIGTAVIDGGVATNNTLHGFVLWSTGAGSVMESGTIKNVTADNNLNHGLLARALTNGTINNISFKNNTSTNNSLEGLYTLASTTGTINNINISNNNLNNNTGMGIRIDIDTENTNSIIVSNNISDANSNGYSATVNNGANVTSINFTDNTADDNTLQGIRASSSGVGTTINSINFTRNVANNNTGNGILLQAASNGRIGQATFNENISNSNARGFLTQTNLSAIVNDVQYMGNLAENNTSDGFWVETLNSSLVSNVNYTGNNAISNGRYGLYISTISNADVDAVSYQNNTAINNTLQGLRIGDSSVLGDINADFGGGALGSTGGNRIFNNTLGALRIDLDGAELKAQNNYWGTPAGLLPANVTLEGGSTIDADPFLVVDPN